MKFVRIVLAPALCAAAFAVLSCGSLPLNYSRSRSWQTPVKIRGTLMLTGVRVERNGSRDSIERELEGLAPLVFGKQGYRMAGDREKADYAADIRAYEREYSTDWRIRRSVSVEVRIWDDTGTPPEADGFFSGRRLPFAAGQVVFTGNNSLSSSETMNRMLVRAVKKALGALKRAERKQRT
jgi:hypothetical protein